MQTQMTLVLRVHYKHNNSRELQLLEARLHQVASDAAGNGLLTGELSAEVSGWDSKVLIGDTAVLTASQKRDLTKLLNYGQEAEAQHYEEMKASEGANSPACRSHIWHSFRKLARAIGLSF